VTVQEVNPHRTRSADLVEFGTVISELGLNGMEARALIDEIQAITHAAVMEAVPKVLDRVRRAHRERLAYLTVQVRSQANFMGMISRDVVLALIAQAMLEQRS
jgi:hypothetical protein